MMGKVILPLSEATVNEIMQQVVARGQEDRVGLVMGKRAVDLGQVVVVAHPEKMIAVN